MTPSLDSRQQARARRVLIAHLERQRDALALDRACTSTLGAARWRMPDFEVAPFHRELAQLCDRLVESAFTGTALQAMVGAPPRHGKSELIALAMTTYALLRAWKERREFAVLYVTAKDTLARRISRVLRGVCARLLELTGDDYFARSPDGEWTAESWETAGGFTMRAIGRGGATGGIGAHLLVLDDLIGSDKVYRSPADRETIWRSLSSDFMSRLMDGGAAIHMETRRGVLDTTARLLEEQGDQWEHHVWECYDPTRPYGDGYLWPRRMNADARQRRGLSDSDRDWLSLYQQRPVPEGGTLIEPGWLLHTFPGSTDPSVVRGSYQSVWVGVDLAATGRATSDHCVFTVVGCRGALRDVLEVVRFRAGFVEQRARLRELCRQWRPTGVVVELAAGGDAIVDELQHDVPGLRGERATRDKKTRLQPWTGVLAAGQLRVPESARWLRDWRAELTAFSGTDGEPDDQVDSLVWALEAARAGAVHDHRDLLRVLRGG